MRTIRVALTGNAGAGKSLVARFFGELGATVVDTDAMGHRLLREPDIKKKVVAQFGEEILGEDGQIDRRKLGRRVFRDPEALRALEKIMKAKLAFLLGKEMARARGLVVVDAALVFEYGLEDMFDVIITVVSDPEEMARRFAQRSGYELEIARRVLSLQMPQEEKAKRSDYVIENRGSLEELREQVVRVLREIQERWEQ